MRHHKKKTVSNGEVPRWFVTYSDVITLLMTFFILLLTFASSEPEGFQMMQHALFGEGGSSGTVGAKLDQMERDTLVVREKPSASRLTSQGSEMPPMYTDPVTQAAARGLSTLEENNELIRFKRFSLDASIHLYVDSAGQPTEFAVQQLRMLAAQMKVLPLDLTLTVTSREFLPAIGLMAQILTTDFEVPAGRVGIAVEGGVGLNGQGLRLTMKQEIP